MRRSTPSLLLAVALAAAAVPSTPLAAQEAVVRTVFFYSPTCPHCHQVIREVLPPLTEQYGERLQIVGVDVSTRGGQALFQATADHFRIPEDGRGVPMLVAGEEFLMGSVEIPERLPGIIEAALQEGGLWWPAVEPLRQALAAQGLEVDAPDAAPEEVVAEPEATPAAPPEEPAPGAAGPDSAEPSPDRVAPAPDGAEGPVAPSEPPTADSADRAAAASPGTPGLTGSLTSAEQAVSPTMLERLGRDPLGNGIAVLVLLGLVVALGVSAVGVAAPPTAGASAERVATPAWLVPTLCVVGMGVAAYLSFVEVSGQEAVCGPVGDCNAVQQSPYARLFGVLPVGVLGLAGYIAMLAAWGVARGGPDALRATAQKGLWAMAFLGTAFSAYLTFLEPFVIGATCAWCVSSALIVGALLMTSTADLRRSGA